MEREPRFCPYCDEEIAEATFPYCQACEVEVFHCPKCQKPVRKRETLTDAKRARAQTVATERAETLLARAREIGLDKAAAQDLVRRAGLDPGQRGETLSPREFLELARRRA
jgi:hypothetical protein